jgi:hypothetical protein
MVPEVQELQGGAVAGPGAQPHYVAAQFRHPDGHGGGRGGLALLAKENFGGYQPGHGGLAGQPANPGDRPPERQRVDAPQGHARHDLPIPSADHWSPMGVALRSQYRVATGSGDGHC